MTTFAVMFEGGPAPGNALQETICRLRHAVALDTLERLLGHPGLDGVVLATNFPHLAAAALRLGARVHETRQPFHFHRELQAAVAATGADAVIYLGGAAVPLLGDAEWDWVIEALHARAPCVVVNNPQSADLVAWNPAGALGRVEPQARDNWLGYVLWREAGLERVLIPHSPGVHFDLDTPTDWLVLQESGRAGARAQGALDSLDWDRQRVRAAARVLEEELAEVGLVGRVGPPVMDYLNTWLRVRLRVFSEERGMKALGRDEQGLVVSFMAGVLADLGPERFFARLGEVCQGLFFDSRVVLAAGGRQVSEWDRFMSDLGRVGEIRDPWVQAFTAAALAAPVPVLLGGHTVVAGGLMVLAERALARKGGASVRYR